MGVGDRAMALVAAHVGEFDTKRLAPQHGVALVAGMTEIEAVLQLRQEAGDQLRVAAEAVAGKDQLAATEILHVAAGPSDGHGADAALPVDEQRLRPRLVDQVDARVQSRLPQSRGQRRARTLRQRVHPGRAVAGVEKAVEHLERQALLLERVDHGGDPARVDADQYRVGVAMGLGGDVGGEARR